MDRARGDPRDPDAYVPVPSVVASPQPVRTRTPRLVSPPPPRTRADHGSPFLSSSLSLGACLHAHPVVAGLHLPCRVPCAVCREQCVRARASARGRRAGKILLQSLSGHRAAQCPTFMARLRPRYGRRPSRPETSIAHRVARTPGPYRRVRAIPDRTADERAGFTRVRALAYVLYVLWLMSIRPTSSF